MHFNKLVRDRIPEILRAQGIVPEVRALNSSEYETALKDKLVEEAGELNRALTSEDLKSELTDVLEVVDAITRYHGFSAKELEAARAKKKSERGGFEQRIFLVSTRDAS